MEKRSYMLIACMVIFATCRRPDDNLPKEKNCVERVTIPVLAHTINQADVSTVNDLFRKNAINNSRFRYNRYTHDTLQTLYPPYTRYDQQSVRVDQYVNGVRVFYADMNFLFLNGSLSSQNGHPTKGTSLNTIPRLNVRELRALFLSDLERFDHIDDRYKDTCFKCEFGYYNLNTGSSNMPELLVKAWRVTTKNSIAPSEYPQAFYKDDNGDLISYDNGIRTFP